MVRVVISTREWLGMKRRGRGMLTYRQTRGRVACRMEKYLWHPPGAISRYRLALLEPNAWLE